MFGTYSLPLPQEKTRAARMIQMDYHMMQTRIRQETGGITLPEDRQAQVLLEEEMRRDLAAILSPEELFEYEVRTFQLASGLRHRLNALEPTEEEFRVIFRLQNELDQLGGPGLQGADEETQRHSEAQEKMQETLRETLGEERYRQYQRVQEYGYGQLVNVAKRLELPRERVDQVYDLREVTEREQQEIQQKAGMSPDERQAALATLAKETREDLTELLGERGLDLYRQHGGQWLHQLQ